MAYNILPNIDPRIDNNLAIVDDYQKQITITKLPKKEVKKELPKQEIKKEIPIEVKKEVPVEVKKELPKEDVLIQIETEEKIIVQESQNRDKEFDIGYFDHIKARYTKILTNVDQSLQTNPNDKNLGSRVE